MKALLLAFFVSVSFLAFGQEEEIRKVMSDQEQCWNNGDLECFMQGYYKSDDLIFVGSSGPKYGWQVTLNNYKKSYPSNAAMGTLSFDLLRLIPLGKKNYLVVGKWSLQRESDNPNGHFSVVFEKIKGEWKIIADHSS